MSAFHDAALPEGFCLLPGLLSPARREALIAELSTPVSGSAGQRELLDQPWCQALARWLKWLPQLRPYLPRDGVAVQCTLFEKSPDRNWLVAPHQDLTIPVRDRIEHDALGGWSIKAGRHFVLAPADTLQRMLAVRLHLDDAAQADGGLRFVPGSHREGVLDDASFSRWRDAFGETAVDAQSGDGLLMRPLVLHASSKATKPTGRRRVLHLTFGPSKLPHGLMWHWAI